MTEHESEEFYNDLRRKLENYGAPPPESVWAGIRQQVPARRPRRWWRGAVLALLVVGTVAYLAVRVRPWQYASGRPAVAAVSPSSNVSSGLSARQHRPAATTQAAEPATQALPAPVLPAPAAPVVSAPEPAAATAGPDRLRPDSRQLTPVAAAPPRNRHLGADIGLEVPRRLAPAVTDSTRREWTERTETTRPAAAATRRAPSPAYSRRMRGGVLAGAMPERRRSGKLSSEPTARVSRAEPSEPAAARAVPGTDAASAVISDPSRDLKKGAPRSPYEPGTAPAAAAANTPLAGRPVPLRLPAVALPGVAAVALPTPERPSRSGQGWALQLLAGPAASYRTLGSGARQLEQLERPAAGFSAQLSAARQVSSRLTLSAGLGYLEVASGLYLRITQANDSLIDYPARTVNFRDYFRLLTVPVEAQYQLGGNQRWRYGVQGGAVPAWLLSARTTEGNSCHCQQQQWQPQDSTRFRRLNLTLSAGGYVGYQAAPGLWLLLRPQAQYFLTSITDPASGRTPRRPWNLGVQAGLSFDLPSKRR